MTVAASLPHQARRAADSVWTDRLARTGMVARGLVYAVVGVLALQIARGGRAAATSHASKEGALQAVAARPFATPLLVSLVFGTAAYALWQVTEAGWGWRDEDDDRKRTAKRAGAAGKAIFYAAFCVTTARFALGDRTSRPEGKQEQTLTARALELTGGRWIVGIAGVVMIGTGFYVAWRGLSQKFEKRLDTAEMGPVEGRAVGVLGTAGLAARGLVFSVAGFLFVRAAIDHQPGEATGLDGTLRVIAHQAYGQVLLVALALGLVAYGLYSLAEARHREL